MMDRARLRPEHRNHVWNPDFVFSRTPDDRPVRMLTLIDEFTRECLAIDVAQRMTSEAVLARLSDLLIQLGPPEYIRSDNGPEFTAQRVRDCLERAGVETLFIEPGSPWENVFIESFNGILRAELFDTLLDARVPIEDWRIHDNTARQRSSPDGDRVTVCRRYRLSA